MPPPKTFRTLRAFKIKSAEPNNIDPTGAPSPLDKQIEIESKGAQYTFASMPFTASAFISLAPSKCNGSLLAKHTSLIFSISLKS